MDQAAKSAFIISQAACVNAKVAGMQAANQHRLSLGQSIAYDEDAFLAVIDEHQIGWNSVLEYLRE